MQRNIFWQRLDPPENLSEARHLLANQSDVYYWIGTACAAAKLQDEAETWWRKASSYRGDFQQMSVMSISDMTYWNASAYKALGEDAVARGLFEQLLERAAELERETPEDRILCDFPSRDVAV